MFSLKCFRLVISALIVCLFCGFVYAQQAFYYSYDERIPLKISTEKISLKFKEGMTQQQIHSTVANDSVLGKIEPLRPACSQGFFTVEVKKGIQLQQLLERLRRETDIDFVNPVFFTTDSLELIPFDEFIVQFEPTISRSEIDELNRRHNVEVVKISSASPNLFTLRVTPASNFPVLEMANLYYEEGRAKWSLPDFVAKVELSYSVNDPYFNYQYYLHNTGQTGGTPDADIDALEAWDISTGSSNCIVAVIDEGIEVHEDLPASRIVSGYDYYYLDSDPSPGGNEAHGMACAGIVSATHNTLGLAGLAPNSKIMPLRIFNEWGNGTSHGNIADAIDFAWQYGADVLSNSWGYNSDEPNLFPDIVEAINRALTQGRGGRGSVVVFSAGNTANRKIGYYGYVTFPANVPGVLTVGAIDKSNNIWNYSPRSSKIDVVAPSGDVAEYMGWHHLHLRGDVWSMDISGQPGYNTGDYGIGSPMYYYHYTWDPPGGDNYPPGNYIARFGGTSAACPQVAGIAALILSVNPKLKAKLTDPEVQNIIKETADDLGSTGYDQDFGWGRVNAYQALLNAYPTITNVATTIAYNNGRRIVADTQGRYHLVYEYQGNVYYRYSDDATVTWTTPVHINAGCGSGYFPSIAQQNSYIYVVWEHHEPGVLYTNELWFRYSSNRGQTWPTNANTPRIVWGWQSGPGINLWPTIAVDKPSALFEMTVAFCTGNGSIMTQSARNATGSDFSVPPSSVSGSNGGKYPVLVYTNSIPYTKLFWTNSSHIYYSSAYFRYGIGWSSPTELCYGLCNNDMASGHNFPTAAVSSNYTMHTAWEAHDDLYNYDVIFYSKNFSTSVFHEFANYTPYRKPSITGHAGSVASMVWHHDSGTSYIRKARYDGSNWDAGWGWSGEGWGWIIGTDSQHPSTSITNPAGGSAKAVWLKGSSAPYDLQFGPGPPWLQKPLMEPNAYHRRLVVQDPTSQSLIAIEIGEAIVTTTSGEEIRTEFEVLDDDQVNFSLSSCTSYLHSSIINLPTNVVEISFYQLLYGKNSIEMKESEAAPINVVYELLDAETLVPVAEFSTGGLVGNEEIEKLQWVVTLEVNELAGKSVVLHPILNGVKACNDFTYTLIHVYLGREATEEREKESSREQVWMTTNVTQNFSLAQNYPNPFNPETEIAFSLPEAAKVSLTVYNILGQVVEVLVDSELHAASHKVTWSGQDFASGVYFYRLIAGEFADTKRMLLLK